MWSNYHKLICSSSFRDKWVAVLGQPCSTLSQYLSRRMLDQLVLLLFPLPSQEEGPTTLQPELTSAEENALRYAAGYVVCSIKEKQKKGKHPMREALLYGLSDVLERRCRFYYEWKLAECYGQGRLGSCESYSIQVVSCYWNGATTAFHDFKSWRDGWTL